MKRSPKWPTPKTVEAYGNRRKLVYACVNINIHIYMHIIIYIYTVDIFVQMLIYISIYIRYTCILYTHISSKNPPFCLPSDKRKLPPALPTDCLPKMPQTNSRKCPGPIWVLPAVCLLNTSVQTKSWDKKSILPQTNMGNENRLFFCPKRKRIVLEAVFFKGYVSVREGKSPPWFSTLSINMLRYISSFCHWTRLVWHAPLN